MGKTLRILVYILFPMLIIVLTVNVLLFLRHEMQKGRLQKLENSIVAVGTTIEAEPATVAAPPQYEARDVQPCTAELVPSPETSSFWKTYTNALEVRDLPHLDLNAERDAMMSYYRIDPQTGKPAKDKHGRYITTGDGTTRGVLTGLLHKAESQLARLVATRKQLVTVRKELVDTIASDDGVNQEKKRLRSELKTIVEKEHDINQKDDQISGLDSKIDELKDLIRSLQDTITDQKTQVQERDKEIEDTEHEIKRLVAEIERRTKGTATAVGDLIRMPQGFKARVIKTNEDWSFVLIKLSDEFLSELTAESGKPIPNLELIVKRKSGDHYVFVTKIKLNHIRAAEKIGVADVLTDWLQMPIEVGDAVFLGS